MLRESKSKQEPESALQKKKRVISQQGRVVLDGAQVLKRDNSDFGPKSNQKTNKEGRYDSTIKSNRKPPGERKVPSNLPKPNAPVKISQNVNSAEAKPDQKKKPSRYVQEIIRMNFVEFVKRYERQ